MIKFLQKIVNFFKSFRKRETNFLYLGGAEALPIPLTAEEEKDRLEKLSKGDESVKAELIEHNLRLVVYIARKFDNTGVELDDLISIGTIGLVKAINSYNLEKNIKLATFASRCIENEILMYLRKVSKQKSEVSFDEPLNVDWEGNELLLSDILGTDSDIVSRGIEKQTEKEILWTALQKLSRREIQIINLRFGLDGNDALTQKEVASLLGISQSYISRLEKRIVKKLKKDIDKAVND